MTTNEKLTAMAGELATHFAAKADSYKTAVALVSCAHFKAGEFVSVKLSHFGDNGTAWFYINRSEKGELPRVVAYPQHHLTDFCL